MQMKKYVLGMDIGGTNTRLGLVDEAYELCDFVIEPSKDLQEEGSTIDSLLKVIKAYIEKYGLDKDIVAVSAGFPSTLDHQRKTILSTPNIKGLNNIPIVELLSETFHLPIFVETDVNMLIRYDMFQNSLPDKGVVCGFYLGTGLGNAIVMNGELLIGKNGASAELGHIPVRGVHGHCGCGNESCIELIASGYKLREIAEEHFPDVFISDIFTKCKDKPEIKKFIEDLALALASEINILDPDYIIIGGGLTKMPDFPFAELEKSIYKYTRKPLPADTLSYIYSEQEQNNGVIGAGIQAFMQLKKGRKE